MENKSFAEINNRNRRHLNLNKRSVFIICILIALISIALRYPRDLNQNFINSDATWHVLLTMEAYDQTSPSIHKYLPIVTLGDEVNKNIHWGATLPDSYGNMYYTSFSGLGFLAPYLFVKLFHLPINPQSLYLFSSLLYLLSFIMIAKIMLKLFKEELSDVIIIAVSGLYLVQPEIIHSQGVVYWHQSLYMLVFLCQTYFFIEQKQMWRKLAFLILCLIGPFLEWTGFIANIGFGLIYFFNSFKQLKNSNESFEYRYYNLLFFMGVALMTFLSGIMFISHFLLVIDFKTLIQSLNFRFGARRVTESVRLIDLLMGYKQSFGFLIIITLGLFSTTVIVPKFRSEFFKSLKETNNGKVLFVSSFAILENFLMMQHATQYSFDRIKIIIPDVI